MNKIYISIIVLLLAICGCRPMRNYEGKYVVSNQTNKDIGVRVEQRPFESAIITVSSLETVSKGVTATSDGVEVPCFIICNLKDTTSVDVTPRIINKIYHYNTTDCRRDSVIKQSLRWTGIDDDYYWTITDELLSIMEKDYTLLELFAEYYKDME